MISLSHIVTALIVMIKYFIENMDNLSTYFDDDNLGLESQCKRPKWPNLGTHRYRYQ